ncbi:MAG: hypothetical protein BIP78_0392 [Candidatus Bipolaricaulis sibiricus]|uniref:Outer membrane protein beta-barrel domain-containing protein n=1 Tax=Bipolaricaulis sibiricus TaxID=2501609 RepID=A0A410FTB7_BIPS1|nr:MAG: hypothetical protein BIP78_0392 [Candidatus Bipolaricaulis sibiricus]
MTAAVSLAGTVAVGRTFLDAPPTRGLYRPTAHNLSRGETQIQFLAFSSPTNPLEFFEFEYGLSDVFEVGARPVSALFGDVRVWAKYHVGTTGPVSLAIPLGLDVRFAAPAWAARAGWVLSWRAFRWVSLHPGLELTFVPAMGIYPYLGAHFDVWTNLKLVLEIDGEDPYLTVGALVWMLGFVRLQIDTPLPSVQLRISITGRF